jgi:hypothetical protein
MRMADKNVVVDIRCSSGAPCSNITFSNFDVDTGSGGPPKYICRSVISEPTGLDGKRMVSPPAHSYRLIPTPLQLPAISLGFLEYWEHVPVLFKEDPPYA